MTIREDLVASAAQFLQDPSVAASPVENRVAFLKAKNLTEEEVHAALARAGPEQGPVTSYSAPPPPSVAPGQQPAYYGGYPPYGWQQPPPAVPKRDWRDWFIMATVVGGVGYGLYALGKRYVYPLVAPPTPERLESDKKSIDEQFEKAFVLVEQLSKDTEELKAAEEERNEKLNNALFELETVISDLKSANRRREDEAQRVRDDVHGLKDSVPKALDAQKSLTDTRLQEINSELKSLKTIVSQRMTSQQPSASTNSIFNRPSVPTPALTSVPPAPATPGSNGVANGNAASEETPKPSSGPSVQDYAASTGRSSPFNSGISASTVKIPEWQRAMATKKSSSTLNGASADGGSGSQTEAGGSSS